MTRRLLIFLLVLAMAAPLAACGRKSALVTPPGSDYPRKYPIQ
jgi:predicted small lipoprotein YifL